MAPPISVVPKDERHRRPQLEEILALCQEYVAAGWMTEPQFQTYQRILQQHPDTLEYMAQEIQSSVTKVPRTNELPKSPADLMNSRAIYLPEDFHQVCAASSLKELFVEMCFYARLGYIQPPCCLQCAYRNSSKTSARSSLESSCTRWVVWRRDANAVLHPDTLAENVVFLSCASAQQLLRSPHPMVRDGFLWDPMQKQLIPSTTKTIQ
jgi:hypothetical protein